MIPPPRSRQPPLRAHTDEPQGDAEPTLYEFLSETWLPAIRMTVRATTFVGYRSHVDRHIKGRIGPLPLSQVDGRSLNRLYAELLARGGRGNRPLSATTVRRVHATLHRALGDAVRWGYLDDNPAAAGDPPRPGAHGREMRTWGPDQLRRFLESSRDDDLHPLWVILGLTGVRRGEALGLRWKDVDFHRSQIAIRQTIVVAGANIHVSTPKTARGRRVVALDAQTLETLRSRRDRQASCGDDDFVFCDENGDPLSPGLVTKAFDRAVRSSGLPRIRLHDLRHTHATIALQAGVHPKIVSERLGHSTVAFTLDVYSHAVAHLQTEAAQAIADAVLGRA